MVRATAPTQNARFAAVYSVGKLGLIANALKNCYISNYVENVHFCINRSIPTKVVARSQNGWKSLLGPKFMPNLNPALKKTQPR